MTFYLNGKILNQNDLPISVRDKGILHGDGLFETMRAYNGTIFALDDHMDRLINSAPIVFIDNIPSKNVLAEACRSTLKANHLKNAKVRLTVTKGAPGRSQPTVLVTAERYPGSSENKMQEGLSAITLTGYRFSNDELARVKSISYQKMSIAKEKAKRSGCNEAILINEKGNVCEGSFTNIFAVRKKEIITPPVTDGLLPGVTRAIVMNIARESGFAVMECSIPVTAIHDMDEVFATNSLIEVVPVKTIDGINTGDMDSAASSDRLKVTSYIYGLYRDSVEDAVDG